MTTVFFDFVMRVRVLGFKKGEACYEKVQPTIVASRRSIQAEGRILQIPHTAC
jgi:hypothetical protein